LWLLRKPPGLFINPKFFKKMRNNHKKQGYKPESGAIPKNTIHRISGTTSLAKERRRYE